MRLLRLLLGFVLPLGAVLAPALRAQPPPSGMLLWAHETALLGLDSAFALAVDPSGRLVVAGGSGFAMAFVRYHPDGRVDSTFGRDGVVTVLADPAARSVVRRVAVEGDGRIVAAGTIGDDVGLVRLLPSGARDASFGANGIARRTVRGVDRVRALLATGTGYYVGGSAEGLANGGGAPAPGRGAFVALFTTNGAAASYAQGGVAFPDLRGPSEATAFHHDGQRLYVGAVRHIQQETALVVVALDANGAEVPLPDGHAFASPAPGGSDGPVGLGPMPDGSLVGAARVGADVRFFYAAGVTGDVSRTAEAGGDDHPRAFARSAAPAIAVVAGTTRRADGLHGFLLSQPLAAAGTPYAFGDAVAAVRYAHGGRPTGFEDVALLLRDSATVAYVAGWTGGGGNRSSFLVAAFALRSAAPVGRADAPRPAAPSIALAPLPVHGRATVRVDLPAPATVRLTLVDLLGRTVHGVLDGAAMRWGAGLHAVALDASAMTPGLYVLRLDVDGRVATRLVPVH